MNLESKTSTTGRQRGAAVKDLRRRGIHDELVLRAISEVPRELFVPGYHSPEEIYGDRALPIGHGQTISELYLTARMLQAAELRPGDRVLDVGTGSGYQSALLSKMGVEIWTLESIETLSDVARETLRSARCERGVHVLLGDGSRGYAPAARYDAIVVCAATPEIPEPLLRQLEEGGRLVIPVGTRDAQRLLRLTKSRQGVRVESLGECRFLSTLAPSRPGTSASEHGQAHESF